MMNLKYIEQYQKLLETSKKSIVINNIYCLNNMLYLYHVSNNNKEMFFIIEESNIVKINIDNIKKIYHLKDNKYNIKKITIYKKQKTNDIYIQLNDVKKYYKQSNDIYLKKLFYDIYKYVF